VPLLPEYVEEITDDEVVFRNYEGKRFVYKQPAQPMGARSCVPSGDGPDIVPIGVGPSARKVSNSTKRKRKAAHG
jgi:hypothetical protein